MWDQIDMPGSPP